MKVVNELCKDVKIPKMQKIKQYFCDEHIKEEEISDKVFQELSRKEISDNIKEGMTIAITCGSRGIAHINTITKAIVDFVKSKDAIPFIIPAMGSHGGATAQGQLDILKDYGVTEDAMGCEIKPSMETVEVGITEEGHHVLIDKDAVEADGIIISGRIKAHTAFRGDYESGLMKMIAIGLGKQQGAEVLHESGFKNMARLMPMFARTTLKSQNIVAGLGIIENAYEEVYDLVGVTKQEIIDKEPELLEKAKSLMGRILIDEADVLIVDKIGKNISGDGMDPNVTGTYGTPYASGGLEKQRIVVLDLTDETHGNYNGIGLASITTKRLIDKINPEITYPNAITSTILDMVKLPLFMETDKLAIQLSIRSCNEIDKDNPKLIRIVDTGKLDEIWISEALIEEAKQNKNIELIGEPEEFPFDENGNLW